VLKVIEARNINDAFHKGVTLLREQGELQETRAGRALVMPCPVTTVYQKPLERVLFSPQRDANPFFHLFEALFYLAGRNDARWLDQFVKDFSSRFAEEDGTLHGSYGFRWRKHFDMEGGGSPYLPDQLETVIRLLRANPNDRRVVIQMWDPVADLGADKKDVPCNVNIFLRIRDEQRAVTVAQGGLPWTGGSIEHHPVLDITVCCRSNDVVWGCYGSNVVQFSILQEYLAARIGVGVGTYTQMSNNFHGYCNVLDKLGPCEPSVDLYQPRSALAYSMPLVVRPETFDDSLQQFMVWTKSDEPDQEPNEYLDNPWFQLTAEPFFVAYHFWKQKLRTEALEVLENADDMSPDWRIAGMEWMRRRMNKK